MQHNEASVRSEACKLIAAALCVILEGALPLPLELMPCYLNLWAAVSFPICLQELEMMELRGQAVKTKRETQAK